MTKPPLHDYQKFAIAFLKGRPRAALFLDMGLGKSRCVLEALTPDRLPALIIAPKRVAEETWPEEIEKWRPDLSYSLVSGKPPERALAIQEAPRADVTIVTFEHQKDVRRCSIYKTAVFDELSGFKKKNVRWREARRLSKQAKNRWGLTGTPAPNGLIDLWAQIGLIDSGERLGKFKGKFKEQYFKATQYINNHPTRWEPKNAEAESKIRALIEDLALSMESVGRVELPDFTVNRVKFDLPAKSRKAYDEIKEQLAVDLYDLGLDGEIHTAANAGVLTGKLSQITAGLMYVDDADIRDGQYDILHKEKTRILQEIVDEAQGSPVLVFYRFKAEQEMIEKAIPGCRRVTEPGIVKEWNAGKVPVMLAHPASASHGLNLQHGGHTAVWTSLCWELELWEQANKRLHRQGQQHPVVVHVIEARGTIDQVIHDRLAKKTRVQDELTDYLEAPI